jgi:hypothetical protein
MMAERRAQCLECKTSFEEVPPTPVGEKAVSRAQDDFSRPNKRRRSGRANEDEEEEEDDSQVGASQERRAVREEEEDELESEEESRPVSFRAHD